MFQLSEVVPWGRSLDEYRRMFALTDDDMGGYRWISTSSRSVNCVV
jgi:hypothetical protein